MARTLTTRYAALLRGINVGGRNKVAMSELRAAFEAHGFADVGTYIQSGNVVFTSDAARKSLEADSLETEVETMLEARFGIPLVVVIRSHRQMRSVIADRPAGFGEEPQRFHSDCVFLKEPLTSAEAMRVVGIREGVDQAWPGPGVIYFARLSALRTKSRMNKIVGTPEYRRMTIRNWATTTRLLSLLDG